MRTEPDPLARRIAVLLVVKLLALAVLWFAFFRAPVPAEPARLFQSDANHVGETSQ
jgi:hypothetical protein